MKTLKKIAILFSIIWATLGYSQSISRLYERAIKSVVLIKTWQPEIIGKGQMKNMVSLQGIGSGFVVSKEGKIMTASHIVGSASLIRVVFSDGEEVPAKVLYSYPMADIALIKLTIPKSTPLSVVTMADSDKVKIGDQVFVISSPFGLGHSLSVGYVSGKHSKKHISSGLRYTEFIQTDAAVNEGSSGGPLFNMKGEVIGIASFILSRSEGFQGISFATTSNIAQELMGKGRPIWIGIKGYYISGPLAKIFNLPQSGGVLVQKVIPNSMGEALGLRGGSYHMTMEEEELVAGGDVLLTLDSIALNNEQRIMKAWSYLKQLKSGDSLKSTVLRSGKVIELWAIVPKM